MPKKKIHKKNWFIRHKISTLIIILILLFLIIPTNGEKSSPKTTIDNTIQTPQNIPAKTEEKTTVATKPAEPEIIYNLTANANVINESIVGISGTSNLPNGALLNITAERLFMWRGESEEKYYRVATSTTSINNGAFDIQLTIDDSKLLTYLIKSNEGVSSVNNNIHLEVIFYPKADNQPAEIINVVGTNGEKLATSPQKDVFGSLTKTPVNRMHVEINTLLPFPYSGQLPQ